MTSIQEAIGGVDALLIATRSTTTASRVDGNGDIASPDARVQVGLLVDALIRRVADTVAM